MIAVTQICDICGNTFIDNTRNHNKKRCSKECDKVADNIALRKWRASHPREDRLNHGKWKKANKEWIITYQKQWRRDALDNNDIYKIKHSLRGRLNSALKGNYKSGSAVRDLGCSIAELKAYLESKFQPGMTWDNWGSTGWHIDHMLPLSSFDLTNREELLKACHYSNLQPLWAEENLSKGSTIPLYK